MNECYFVTSGIRLRVKLRYVPRHLGGDTVMHCGIRGWVVFRDVSLGHYYTTECVSGTEQSHKSLVSSRV